MILNPNLSDNIKVLKVVSKNLTFPQRFLKIKFVLWTFSNICKS